MGASTISKLVLPSSHVHLLEATCKGNLPAFAKRFVEAGAQMTSVSFSNDGTLIHIVCASYHGSDNEAVELVQYLQGLGGDLFARRHDGQTPLHLAAATGKVATIRYILARSRNRQQRHPKNESGKTPLMLTRSDEVMKAFAPWQPNLDNETVKDICKWYPAETTSWDETSVFYPRNDLLTMHQLLYERDNGKVFETSNEKSFRWIHLPANNIEWCADLLLRWCLERDEKPEIQDLEAAQQAFDQQHVSRTPQGRFIRPGVYCTHPSRRIIFIAAPYMDFETSSNLDQMQNTLRVLASGRAIAPKLPYSCQNLYNTYIPSAALHPRRTLDQYLYYNMDTSERDTDQVIQRYQKTQKDRAGMGADADMLQDTREASHQAPGEDKEETTIMVDQLWMWILGDDLIVTCGARRWRRSTGHHEIYQRLEASLLSLDRSSERGRVTSGEAAVQVMTACFGTFDRHARRAPNLQFMSMFEQSLGVIGAKDSDLLRKFSSAYCAKEQQGNKQRIFCQGTQ